MKLILHNAYITVLVTELAHAGHNWQVVLHVERERGTAEPEHGHCTEVVGGQGGVSVACKRAHSTGG